MKSFLIAACIASFWLGAGVSPGGASCRVTVRATVEVSAEFSLADLLGSGSCLQMRRAAARVLLGGAPMTGSVRVLAGNEVRSVLQKLAAHLGQDSGELVTVLVPERITVRRAGARASCADIARSISVTSAGPADCGAADRIPHDAALEFSPPAWDPALRSWQLYARCVHPADCVPFLVRLRGHEAEENVPDGKRTAAGEALDPLVRSKSAPSTMARLAAASSAFPRLDAPGPARALALVHTGQTVTLLWDQDGIRLVIPAVALDPGAPGEPVRARIVRGGRLVRAVVVSAGMVRAVS
ncbi:MAG: flagella basal body P-ring formation protein FlgA [Candidatus Sulfotelmatobacter sp.]